MKAVLYAFLAAVFCAVNSPASKVLLENTGPATMAALLYLGAGIGIAGLSLFSAKDRKASSPLSRKDLPFAVESWNREIVKTPHRKGSGVPAAIGISRFHDLNERVSSENSSMF